MNTQRDFDDTSKAWLAKGPAELADRVLEAALREVHLTQQRRPLTALPGRISRWSAPLRATLAVLIAAVAIGSGIRLLGPHASGPGVAPTPTPATTKANTERPTTSRLDPLTWTPFTSTINGFSARFPSDLTVTPATRPGDLNSILGVLEPGHNDRDAPDTAFFDVAASRADKVEISSVSTKLPDGMTPDAWLAAYRQPIVHASGDMCFPTRDKWEAVVVDGESNGGLYYGCQWYALWYRSPSPIPNNGTRGYFESLLFVQGRVYIFQVNLGGLSRFTTAQDFVQSKAADEATRQLLREFLTTVTFDTAKAKNP